MIKRNGTTRNSISSPININESQKRSSTCCHAMLGRSWVNIHENKASQRWLRLNLSIFQVVSSTNTSPGSIINPAESQDPYLLPGSSPVIYSQAYYILAAKTPNISTVYLEPPISMLFSNPEHTAGDSLLPNLGKDRDDIGSHFQSLIPNSTQKQYWHAHCIPTTNFPKQNLLICLKQNPQLPKNYWFTADTARNRVTQY